MYTIAFNSLTKTLESIKKFMHILHYNLYKVIQYYLYLQRW